MSRRVPVTVFDVLLGVVFLINQVILSNAFSALDGTNNEPRVNWDGQNYLEIASHGYPSGGSPGAPPANYPLYAFHPLFPSIVRALNAGTGWAVSAIAPLVSLGLGAIAVVILSCWLRPNLGRSGSVAAAVMLVSHPATAVFQMGYSEGLALLLLVLTWSWLDTRHYALACFAVSGLALARPLAAPVVATIAAVALWDRLKGRSLRSLRGPAAVVTAGTIGLAAWPMLAGAISGDPGVYWAAHVAFVTEGTASSPAAVGVKYPAFGALLLMLVLCTILVSARLLPDGTPAMLRVWGVVYPIYVLVGALFAPSLIRYSIFAFPLGLALTPFLRRWPSGPLLLLLIWAAGLYAGFWWVMVFVPSAHGRAYP